MIEIIYSVMNNSVWVVIIVVGDWTSSRVEVGVDLRLRRLIVVIVHELRLESASSHLIPIFLFLLLPNLQLGLLALASQALRQWQGILGSNRCIVDDIGASPLEGVRIRWCELLRGLRPWNISCGCHPETFRVQLRLERALWCREVLQPLLLLLEVENQVFLMNVQSL